MKRDPEALDCPVDGKLVAEWLLRESAVVRLLGCSVPYSNTLCKCAQSAYATISNSWSLTINSHYQTQPEPAFETLGSGQNNRTRRTLGIVSLRRAIVGEILIIGSLSSGLHTICHLLIHAD